MTMTTSDTQPHPLMQILQMMNGFWMTQCIGVAAQLGIADHLVEGAKSVETLAQLTTNSIRGLAIWSGSEPTHWQMWGNLLYSVKTGKPAFEQVTGMPIFAYTAQDPEFAAVFNQAMTSASAMFNPAIVHAYDFSAIKTLVDIGGGQGAFLAGILQANLHLNGIVYDLPYVIEGAASYLENLGLQNRCQAIGGSFLESVPEGGDAYILKNTLTNWDDEHAIRILKNCYRAMPQGGKLLMAHSVIAPGNRPDLGKFTDLEMLLVTSAGRERSAPEFEQVLNAAGFQLVQILPTQCPSSIIEAIKP